MEYDDEKPYEEELSANEFDSEDPVQGKKKAGDRRVVQRKRFVRLLYNKFFLVVVFFLVWITFFDGNNLISRFKLNRELHRIKNQKEYYLEEIAINAKIRDQLTKDMKEIERYGREQYLMKRDREDIFLIIDQ